MTQIKLDPELGTYYVGSMMITPASALGSTGGTRRLTCLHTLPRGSHSKRRRMLSCSRSIVRICSNNVAPEGGRTPPMITSPTSPSAWQPTTEIIRRGVMNYDVPRSSVGKGPTTSFDKLWLNA